VVWLTDGELLINVVMHSKPKVMTGLNQKVRGKDQKLPILLTQTTQPPAERQSLTHPGTHAERGKPVPSPRGDHYVFPPPNYSKGSGSENSRQFLL